MTTKDKRHATIYLYTNFMQIVKTTERAREALRFFIKRNLIAKQLVRVNGRWQTEDGKIYAYASADKLTLHLHINLKEELFSHFKNFGIYDDELEVIEVSDDYPVYQGLMKLDPNIVLHDYQAEIVEYVLDKGHRKIINLPMGKGKTLTALKCAELIGQRTLILLLPKYKEQWVKEISQQYKNVGDSQSKPEDRKYLVIDKIDKLYDALEAMKLDEDGLGDIWCIVLTITTLMKYIENYRDAPDLTREDMVAPHLIWSTLQVGLRITDEVHEHFHRNYLIDLHTHIKKSIYLSATLDPTGSFEDKMYKTMYPMKDRMGGDQYKPYIECTAVMYSHANPQRWRCSLQGKYNHAIYEANFTKGKLAGKLRKTYFEMITSLLTSNYLTIRKPKQKAIIFFSTVELCNLYKQYIQAKQPHLLVKTYTATDDYYEMLTGDIIVSTPGSAGTGVDIPGLILNIMTISRRSQQSNLQILGRLRDLERFYPGQRPRFIYLVASDIDAPMHYHREKQELFKSRTVTQDTYYTDIVLEK